MSDLRDKLLLAGLVSDAQVQAVAEQSRARSGPARQGKGRGQNTSEPRRDRPGRGAPSSGGPAEALALARERDNLALDPAERERRRQRAHQIAREGRLSGRTQGHRRWYFLDRSGSLAFVELHDKAAATLEAGEAAIVESAKGEAWLVDRGAATKLLALEPEWVRHCTPHSR